MRCRVWPARWWLKARNPVPNRVTSLWKRSGRIQSASLVHCWPKRWKSMRLCSNRWGAIRNPKDWPPWLRPFARPRARPASRWRSPTTSRRFAFADKAPEFIGERRYADHIVATVDGVFPFEVESHAPGFLRDDFERRQIPRLGLRFQPGVGSAGCHQHCVEAAAHAPHRPEFRKPRDQIRRERIAVHV